MTQQQPVVELGSQYSDDGAQAVPWSKGRSTLEQADIYWLTTVKPEGAPHVTPLIGVWMQERFFFCTGPEERKAKNLEANKNVVVTTGKNDFSGLDVVVEGAAEVVSDEQLLQAVADAIDAKYENWHFDLRDGALYGPGGRVLVFGVTPSKIFGFRKGDEYSQTRWSFADAEPE